MNKKKYTVFTSYLQNRAKVVNKKNSNKHQQREINYCIFRSTNTQNKIFLTLYFTEIKVKTKIITLAIKNY